MFEGENWGACGVRVPAFLIFFTFLVCQAIVGEAQAAGSISLSATDGGGALPGVLVTAVHNTDAGVKRTAITNATGRATFLNLKPGCYTVTIELEGFVTQTKTICVRQNGQAAEVAILQLASVEEEIVVQGPIPSVTAGASASRAEVNSTFGIGTVVTGSFELFLLSADRHINRAGFDLGTQLKPTGPGYILGTSSRGFLTFGGGYAEGSETLSGSATVGTNGVDRVALTFLHPDTGGITGTFSNVAGDELVGRVHMDNEWFVGHFGYREVIPLNGPNSAQAFVGGAFHIEYFSQDFMGNADILRGGTSLVGQQTKGSTSDKYYGVMLNGGIIVPIANGLRLIAEGFVVPSYHTGDADLSQTTNLGAGVTQMLEFSNDGFAFSGGASVSLALSLGKNASLNLSYEYSVLDEVSEVQVPAKPTEQPAFFSDGAVDRQFGRISFTTKFSDVRLKRDIEQVGRLENGLGLYRYRYKWSDTRYVGVMAQEVRRIVPEAVHRGVNGYLRVNYAPLGIRLQTWDEWKRARNGAFVSVAKITTAY